MRGFPSAGSSSANVTATEAYPLTRSVDKDGRNKSLATLRTCSLSGRFASPQSVIIVDLPSTNNSHSI